jgi:hypothetical protein
MFNFGGGGYDFVNIAVDSHNNIYIPDGENSRIRVIKKKPDGIWWVSTFAGGGTVTLTPGQQAPINNLLLANPTALAVDAHDNLWSADSRCLYKFTPGGTVYCYSIVYKPNNMQADKIGNVYLQARLNASSPYFIVGQDGVIRRLAGVTDNEYYALSSPKPIDGLTALESYFMVHDVFAVTDDGSTVYGGNGDESVLRRVFKDGQSRSLYKDGWHRETVNRLNGWQVGGAVGVDNTGSIYLTSDNPPYFFPLRKLIPQ